jgi:hypothetical protein
MAIPVATTLAIAVSISAALAATVPIALATPVPLTVSVSSALATAVPVAITLATAAPIALSIPLVSLSGDGRGDDAIGGIERGERGSGEAQGHDAQPGGDQKNVTGRDPSSSGTPKGGPRSHRHPAWYNDEQPSEYTVSSPGFNRGSGAELAI